MLYSMYDVPTSSVRVPRSIIHTNKQCSLLVACIVRCTLYIYNVYIRILALHQSLIDFYHHGQTTDEEEQNQKQQIE